MIHLLGATVPVPYPSWLNPADNTWQVTAATFVGLMSLPGLAVLYASIVPKKWAVNVLAMMFAGFSLVLIAWVLWSYKMGFGATSIGGGVNGGVATQHVLVNGKLTNNTGTWQYFFEDFVGKPGGITNSVGEQGQAVSNANSIIPFHFPTSSLAYFQFVFAAITPLLFLGSVLGRIKFFAWCLLVPLWSTFVYGVDAFLLWGGGYFAQEGALDFSGGYVIHMSAGVSGFVAAWVLGPRLLRDRQHALPNNLVMAAVGAGILWLGWNGFNGGDPYYAGASAAAAVINTNIATATGVVVWMILDAWLTKERKPTFLGGVNGMICGLVGITPCAGWVNGRGAIYVGAICSAGVWVAWNYLSKVRPFSKVDDALGVVYTHGIAGFMGGMLLGIFGDPNMIEYGCGHLANNGSTVVATSASTYASVERELHPVQRERPAVHGLRPPAVGTVPRGHLGDLLVGADHLHPDEGHRLGPAWCPLQGRGPRGRRPRHPRRGGVPRREFATRTDGAFAMAGVTTSPPEPREDYPVPGAEEIPDAGGGS